MYQNTVPYFEKIKRDVSFIQSFLRISDNSDDHNLMFD
jgi:hypothetical protein